MAQLWVARSGIVMPVRVDPSGRTGPTPGQARGPRWRRTGPRYYVPAEVDGRVPEQRIVEAVASLGPGAAVTGWAALRWLGARWFDGLGPDGRTPLDVPIALGDQRTARDRPGVALSEDWLHDDDVIMVDGLPITIPERSVSYAARVAPHVLAATQTIDMAAYDDLVDLAQLAAYTARLAGRQGTVQLRTALSRASENAWSPQEVRMRQVWEDHRAGALLLCNAPVFDLAGNHLFTPDLFDPVAGIGGEYDGVVHNENGTRSRDLTREDLTRRVSVEIVTMMAGAGEKGRFLTRLDGAYIRAAEQRGPRAWTLQQPDWWADTSTVARRQALTPYERHLWLRHRRRT